MARYYLDHASTSPPRPEVVAAIEQWSALPAADPGRVHLEAQRVRAAIEEAREHVASLIGVRPRQVIFTSGATEAINAAVWGAVQARPGARILCADVEHSAVREASSRHTDVTTLPVDETGCIDPEGVTRSLKESHGAPVALVHCQWANHEVGTIQPVAEVVERARQSDALVHIDAAAACGQVPIDFAGVGDLISISAHKFGGPPGVGALIVRRGLRLDPFLVGGQQERARRAGMENTVGILGFGAAAAALSANANALLDTEAALSRGRISRLLEVAAGVEDVTLIGPRDPARRVPHLLCLGVMGVEAEPIVLSLDRRGIAIHSGSACSSEALEPSPVLQAMGADPSHSLRPSVGWSTTDADIDAFAEAFPAVVSELRQLRA